MTPRLFMCALLACLFTATASVSFAQMSAAPDSATAAPDTAAAAPATYTPPPVQAQSSKPPLRDRIYFGGSVVFNMGGDVSTIGVYPMIGYKIRPKWSVGLEAGYEHVTFDDFDQSADNYGGSLFTRYRLIPRMYLHAEYQMINYEVFTSPVASDRDWVPFLLLGGGLSTMVAPRTWAYVEVLFDVLQDNGSPYDDWEPFVSAGIGVGF
ncbi:MAG TPA: hypothetical protein VF247_12790 [Candidatus Krumholzibacteria bacterium]